MTVVSSRCVSCLSRAASDALMAPSSSAGMYSTVRPSASCTASVRLDMKRCVYARKSLRTASGQLPLCATCGRYTLLMRRSSGCRPPATAAALHAAVVPARTLPLLLLLVVVAARLLPVPLSTPNCTARLMLSRVMK
jgi:hypothetical protein